jgi:hypothetical protein
VRLILEEGLQSDLPQAESESDTPQSDELQPVERHRLDESVKGLTKTYWNTHEIFLYRSRYALSYLHKFIYRLCNYTFALYVHTHILIHTHTYSGVYMCMQLYSKVVHEIYSYTRILYVRL